MLIEPPQARAFVERARLLVAAGRPPCPLCGQPLSPGGHVCAAAERLPPRQQPGPVTPEELTPALTLAVGGCRDISVDDALRLLRDGELSIEGRLVDASNATFYCAVTGDGTHRGLRVQTGGRRAAAVGLPGRHARRTRGRRLRGVGGDRLGDRAARRCSATGRPARAWCSSGSTSTRRSNIARFMRRRDHERAAQHRGLRRGHQQRRPQGRAPAADRRTGTSTASTTASRSTSRTSCAPCCGSGPGSGCRDERAGRRWTDCADSSTARWASGWASCSPSARCAAPNGRVAALLATRPAPGAARRLAAGALAADMSGSALVLGGGGGHRHRLGTRADAGLAEAGIDLAARGCVAAAGSVVGPRSRAARLEVSTASGAARTRPVAAWVARPSERPRACVAPTTFGRRLGACRQAVAAGRARRWPNGRASRRVFS